MRKIYSFLAIMVLVCSCEKEIDYKGKGLENFLVVNSLLMPDSLLKCKVSRSNTLFDEGEIQMIEDAKVEVYKNDELLEVLPYSQKGYYRSASLKPEIGQNYRFKVIHTKYPDVSCKTTIPSAPVVSVSSCVMHDDNNYDVTLAINDLPGDDYYRIVAYTFGEHYEHNMLAYVGSNDPVLNFNKVVVDDSEFTDYPDNYYKVFDDALFDGNTYELRLSLYLWEPSDLYIVVQHLTKDLYLYYSSVQSHIYYDDDPFSEPVQIHSNVNNGAGIMGGLSQTVMEISTESN